MAEARTTLTATQRDILARDAAAALIVAPVGVGKTFMGVTRALEFIKEKGFVLFLATNMTTKKEQSEMLDRLDIRGKRRIVVTTQNSFFQQWKKKGKGADDMGEELVRAFDCTRGLDIVVVVDEAHMLFIEKKGAKASKMQAFLRRFPRCRVVGITATPNLDDEERTKRCAQVFGADRRVISVQEGSTEHRAIQRELPFTPQAVRVSAEGIRHTSLGGEEARSLYTLLSLHAALEADGRAARVSLGEVRQITRELVADTNNLYLVEALVGDILEHPLVELQPLTSVVTQYRSGKVQDVSSGGLIAKVVRGMGGELDDSSLDDAGAKGGDGALTLDEPGATKSGRIVAIFSSVSNSALVRFGEALRQTLVEHKDGEQPMPEFLIYNAFAPFPVQDIANLAKAAREGKKTIYILCSNAYVTGVNLLCGFVDTVVEHGTFSESTRTQLVGRIACRPVTAWQHMPQRTVHVFTNSSLQLKIDEHLRRCAQAEGTGCVDSDATITRKRSRATSSGYTYTEKQLPAYATLRKHMADCGFQYVRDHMDAACAHMRDLTQKLSVELVNARQERGHEHTLECAVAYCSVKDGDDDDDDDDDE